MEIDGTVYLELMELSGSLPLSPIDFLTPFSNTSAITQLLVPMCFHILQILISWNGFQIREVIDLKEAVRMWPSSEGIL